MALILKSTPIVLAITGFATGTAAQRPQVPLNTLSEVGAALRGAGRA